jgi:hypothetical protein
MSTLILNPIEQHNKTIMNVRFIKKVRFDIPNKKEDIKIHHERFTFTSKLRDIFKSCYYKLNITDDRKINIILDSINITHKKSIDNYEVVANPIQWLLRQEDYKKDIINRDKFFSKMDKDIKYILFDNKNSTIYNKIMSKHFPKGYGIILKKELQKNNIDIEVLDYYKLYL